MAGTIKDYRNMVEQPWGKMFYELIYRQLNLPEDRKLKILDFGAGFCITTDYYAKFHDVTALEPNPEMTELRVENNGYTLINEGFDYLKTIEANSFDLVICHNVLEYADEKEKILKELARVLKPAGTLSVVKHNLYGRVMGSAVLADDPKTAISLLNEETENSMFGSRSVYDSKFVTDVLADNMVLAETYGIRAFFGLSSNNEIKYTDDWYQSMLELETKTYSMDEFKKIAFFNHLILKKKD
ncbi:MAG: class I SAM-dependent methyltransferase [Lachnospiraceae bacterium]|nr:class I SAM-dependent methyltransferase [Lachnospiraceae bacterium]